MDNKVTQRTQARRRTLDSMASTSNSPDSPTLHPSSFAAQVPELAQQWRSASFPDATLAIVNEDLCHDVPVRDIDLTGGVDGWATAYSGHQFGHFNPVLGDGRALLLGDTADGREVQLKSSGPTPFSRGGDGFGTLGSMVREYVVSEVMHHAGIPTTRIAAVIDTGEDIIRDGQAVPGGIAVRVANSHVRVGTMQFARLLDEHRREQQDRHPVLPHLVDYVASKVIPGNLESPAHPDKPALKIFEHAVRTQAALIANWIKVGFVHGVMNTDNISLAGETIDYGPCAFVDTFDANTKFSSIDTGGRYAFGQQPSIAMWNLARLAEAICEDCTEEATEVLQTFPEFYRAALHKEFAATAGGEVPSEGVDLRQWWREQSGAGQDSAELQLPAIPRNYEIERAVAAAGAKDFTVCEELVASVKEKKWVDPGPPAEDAGPYVTYCGT